MATKKQSKARAKAKPKKRRGKNPQLMLINGKKTTKKRRPAVKKKRKVNKRKASPKKRAPKKVAMKKSNRGRNRRRKRNPASTLKLDLRGWAKAIGAAGVLSLAGEGIGNKVVPVPKNRMDDFKQMAIKIGVPLLGGLGLRAMGQKEAGFGAILAGGLVGLFQTVEKFVSPNVPWMATIGLGQVTRVFRDAATGQFWLKDGQNVIQLGAAYVGYDTYAGRPRTQVAFNEPNTGRRMRGEYLGRYQIGQAVADVIKTPDGQNERLYFLGAVQRRDFALGAVQSSDPMLQHLGAVQPRAPDLARGSVGADSEAFYQLNTQTLAGVKSNFGRWDMNRNLSYTQTGVA